MFDNNVPFDNISYLNNDTAENNALAEKVAEDSIVMLKNNGILPLRQNSVKTIAVVGPNADSRTALEGNYSGMASQYITILDGIREAAGPDTRVIYTEGCHLYKETDSDLSRQKGDRIAEAVEAASLADVVICVLGLDARLEGEEGHPSNAFDGGDKRDLLFPGLQTELLKQLVTTGKPVILINMTGSAMDLRYADENCAAVLQAWYPGGRGGRAVASVLFGKPPSGKLPVTFYKSSEELPDITDYSLRAGNGRTYRFMKNEALYPFGFGLSYTKFAYRDLKARRIEKGAAVSVTVKNAGDYPQAARETSLLFVSHNDKTFDAYNWSLKGIAETVLNPGEEAKLTFDLTQSDLSVFDANGNEIFDEGAITIYVGGSQPDARSVGLTGAAPLSVVI
ncbi:MAG: glycoside hydrolase family 3 C-terminal domain-containing protein [Clostridiales bacterium]|nr:glycoside hydrolase family 3 C-terminal domain-containing protein [Clostridiales bacterium]